MIEQAGGAPRLGFVVPAPGYITGKADGAIGERAQAIAPGARIAAGNWPTRGLTRSIAGMLIAAFAIRL